MNASGVDDPQNQGDRQVRSAGGTLAYLPGYGNVYPIPLGRFLPLVPGGVIPVWLGSHVPAGAWVLDPFGASPQAAIEAARAGYRVLIASNNPVTRFILEMLACAPGREDYMAALADLAASRKGDERLERHTLSLYETDCTRCGKNIYAQGFLWDKQADAPYARLYSCPYCGDSGERPLSPSDLARLAGLPPAGLHRARALERVAALDDPARPDVENALTCYRPRSLYALFTLMNKLESYSTHPAKKALLTALLLTACDEASTLWPYPAGRNRPRQLAVPSHFREHNLWYTLEAAVDLWAQAAPQVPLKVWPETAPPGGITLYQGRLKEVADQLGELRIQGVFTAVPRPNQAYWTLSALWSGWLWGREAATPLRSALSRRRYDWNWHAVALQSVLNFLPSFLPPKTPVFGLFPEVEAPFIGSAFLAADSADLVFSGMALRSELEPAQVEWEVGMRSHPVTGNPAEAISRAAIQTTLRQRGEPTPHLVLYSAAVAALAREHALQGDLPPSASLPGVQKGLPSSNLGETFSQLQGSLRRAFADRTLFIHYGGSEQSPEAGLWWLREEWSEEASGETEGPTTTLAGRVEVEVVHYLQKHPGCPFDELDLEICRTFRGLVTPSTDLVRMCLVSYGVEDPAHPGGWILRPEDSPSQRRREISEINTLLVQTGERLGYTAGPSLPVTWIDSQGHLDWVFYVTASSLAEGYIFAREQEPACSLIVLPGGRANLLTYKIERDPRLEQAVREGWRFLKFRHLRSLAENPLLNKAMWASQVNSDPPEHKAITMAMF
jgi:hypothetical protein